MKQIFAAILFFGVCLVAKGQTEQVKAEKQDQLLSVLPDSVYPPDTIMAHSYCSEWTKTHYPERIHVFKSAPLFSGGIVFLGNSITEQGGDWAARFGVTTIQNRGISGDVTEGVLFRLGEIYYFRPKSVFLLIGINDISLGKTAQFVSNNILRICDSIHAHTPNTKVFVQTILPTAWNAAIIRAVNTLLREAASAHNFTVIELFDLFADSSGLIKAEYTTDGVHLTPKAYDVWKNFVKGFLVEATSIPESTNMKKELVSYTAYPNPFSSDLTISFTLPFSQKNAVMEVYNLNGTLIKSISQKNVIAGKKYNFNLDGADFAGATFFAKLIAKDNVYCFKLIKE